MSGDEGGIVTRFDILQHSLFPMVLACAGNVWRATHCNILQHTQQHITTHIAAEARRQRVAGHTLQRVAYHTLQHAATHCSTLQHTQEHAMQQRLAGNMWRATHCNPLQHTATHCNPLQPTATHCTHCNPLQPSHDDWYKAVLGTSQVSVCLSTWSSASDDVVKR